jgi:hypothetical protein
VEENEWVALVGFGSPALSLGSRERFIGWSEKVKLRRLRFVMSNQRFCVLDEHPRKNLASFVLARSLRRANADAERCFGDPVVRSGSAPRVLATLCNLTIGVLRLVGVRRSA